MKFYLQDSNYNVVALADSTGAVVERCWYEPYGKTTFTNASGGSESPSSSQNNTLAFQGQRYDNESGLYYFRNRYYSPVLGRFLQRDPMEYEDGTNLYEFGLGCPVNILDPLGLWNEDVHYTLTRSILSHVPCLKDHAEEIAQSDKDVDSGDTDAGFGLFSPRTRFNNAFYHGMYSGHRPMDDRAKEDMNVLWNRSMVTVEFQNEFYHICDMKGLGQYLHRLQDEYSHTGHGGRIWGHFWSGKLPDDVRSDPNWPNAEEMAQQTYDEARKWARECMNCCKEGPDYKPQTALLEQYGGPRGEFFDWLFLVPRFLPYVRDIVR